MLCRLLGSAGSLRPGWATWPCPYTAAMRVWAVRAVLASGEVFDEVVLADTAADANVVLGDRIRATRSVDEGGQAGIVECSARVVAWRRAGEAINPPG